MTVLEIVKILLKWPDADDDTLLQIYVITVIQRILNYCRIFELPEELYYTAAQMVVDLYKINSGAEIGSITGAVSSVTEGSRSVAYSGESESMFLAKQADERISKIQELNEFRQVYKIMP